MFGYAQAGGGREEEDGLLYLRIAHDGYLRECIRRISLAGEFSGT